MKGTHEQGWLYRADQEQSKPHEKKAWAKAYEDVMRKEIKDIKNNIK